MGIPVYRADINMPAHQIYLKFLDQDQPAMFVSGQKAIGDAKNFDLAADILRKNSDETSKKLSDWFVTLAARYRGEQ